MILLGVLQHGRARKKRPSQETKNVPSPQVKLVALPIFSFQVQSRVLDSRRSDFCPKLPPGQIRKPCQHTLKVQNWTTKIRLSVTYELINEKGGRKLQEEPGGNRSCSSCEWLSFCAMCQITEGDNQLKLGKWKVSLECDSLKNQSPRAPNLSCHDARMFAQLSPGWGPHKFFMLMDTFDGFT